MTVTPERLAAFLRNHRAAIAVTVAAVRGSVPREAGAWMLVAEGMILGTIGGGQLEFMAIDRARSMLSGGEVRDHLSIPLGPAIGQCCGGNVELDLEAVDDIVAAMIGQRVASEMEHRPHVYLFGAGHVGRALAEVLSLLPLNIHVIETRPDELRDLPKNVLTEVTPLPEAAVDSAPPHSAFIVLTHDHALDFLITRAALQKGDAAYVGMIGSKTKRATFESQYRRDSGPAEDCRRLICPIGVKLNDKRPEIIAALVATEVLVAVSSAE